MAKKQPVICTIDDGYHDNKLYNGKDKVLLPSFATTWREPNKDDLLFDKEGKIDPYSYIKAEIPEQMKPYLVGAGAIQQDTSGSWIGPNNKHKDKRFIVILRTCLALITPKDTDVIDLLEMNLPAETADDENRVEYLRNKVVGWHKIKLTLADGTVIEREINVKDIYISNQPFAAYCSVVLDKHGEIADEELAAGFNVLGDIGARTFNRYAWDAMKPALDLKGQSNDGMFTAYTEIAKEIKRITSKDGKNGTSIPDLKVPLTLARGEMNGVDQETLTRIKEEAYDDHANKVVSIMEKSLANVEGQIHTVIWGCGGAEVLEADIRNYMTDYKMLFLNRFSVCIGGYNLAVRVYKARMQAAGQVAATVEQPEPEEKA